MSETISKELAYRAAQIVAGAVKRTDSPISLSAQPNTDGSVSLFQTSFLPEGVSHGEMRINPSAVQAQALIILLS